MSEPCWWIDLGRRGYEESWALQRRLVVDRQRGFVPDLLLFVEHPPTYTLGRAGRRDHLLIDDERLSELGARFVETDRGGDITFHGPGQIVGYPILDLAGWRKDVHRYLRALEEVLLDVLDAYAIRGFREPAATGVWHETGKLAAIGVRVSKWVTSHGFALNVTTDLHYFDQIVPCGIVGRKVSSMAEILGVPPRLEHVRDRVASSFGSVFGREMKGRSELELSARIE